MHGQLSAAFLQGGFQLFDEQALAAHFAERAVQDLVAARGHAQQINAVATRRQQRLHMFGLPQGKAAFTGGNGQQKGHGDGAWEIVGNLQW